ncbi:MAG: RNA polymerase sigma factor [Phycisphaerales bacterium]
MPECSVKSITTAIASGDSEALAAFYETWFDWMLHESRRATGRDESFALDVVQESMMRVIRSIRPIESEAALRAWLRAVIRSAAVDLIRTERRRSQRDRARPTESDESDEVRVDERLAWLRDELSRVDHSTARLLNWRFRAGWTLARIGAALGLETGAVDGRIARAVAALRNEAKEEFDVE